MQTSKIIIETERLYLTEFHIEIAESFYDLNLNKNVLRYTGDEAFASVEQARQFLAEYDHYEIFGYGRWSVYKKDTHQWLGWCGLKNAGHLVADIGFRFFEEEWNKGYATESAKACLDYGFNSLGLEKIIARASSDNIGSIKVIKKLSLQYDKTEDYEGIPEAMFFSIIKNQYKK